MTRLSMLLVFVLACSKSDSSGTAKPETPAPEVAETQSEGGGEEPETPSTADPAEEATKNCTPVSDNSLDCAESTRTGPFYCVRFPDEETIEVQPEKDGPFYTFTSIDGIESKALLSAARSGCQDGKDDWKKRIAEDLSQVMVAACGELGDTAKVVVTSKEGEAKTFEALPVDKDRRRSTKDCWEKAE